LSSLSVRESAGLLPKAALGFVSGGGGAADGRREEKRGNNERGELHGDSCRPMKSRISARALSVSALACPVKPWRAPGKRTRSIGPPACWYALTNASVIAAGTLSSSSG